MAFSDLQMKTCSEKALQAIYPELVNLKDFCYSFSDQPDRKYASIVIPTWDLSAAGDFALGTNQYDSGKQECDGSVVNLSTHVMKSIQYTDRDCIETEVNWIGQAGEAIGHTLAKAINSNVMGMLNSTNIALTAEVSLGTKQDAAQLYKIAADNGLDVHDSVVILTPTLYAKVLGLLDAMAYNGPEAIRYGRVPGLFGFRAVEASTYLPDGVDGVVINRNTIGIASRYLEPMADCYEGAWKTVDPDSGFTVGWRSFADKGSGLRYLAGEVLYGATIFWGGKYAVRLTEAD